MICDFLYRLIHIYVRVYLLLVVHTDIVANQLQSRPNGVFLVGSGAN